MRRRSRSTSRSSTGCRPADHRLRDERERNADLALRSRQLAERTEILFGEFQHRVSNNLQMIGAVLSCRSAVSQLRPCRDPRARQCRDRIDADRSDPAAALRYQRVADRARQFLHNCCRRDRGGRQSRNRSLRFRARPGRASPDALIPLALILAEAIANAIEQGGRRDHGASRVDLVQAAPGFHLCVTDDGAGIAPGGFDTRASTSLGLKIATTLARQLGGSFDVRTPIRSAHKAC